MKKTIRKLFFASEFWVQFLFGLVICLVSLGQLQRIEVQPGVAVYIHELLIFGWIGLTFMTSPKFRRFVWDFWLNRSLVEKIFLIWIAVGLAFATIHHEAVVTALLFLLRLFMYFNFIVLLQFLITQKLLTRVIIFWAFFGLGMLFLYFGFLQYIFVPDTRFLFFLGWDDHYARLISTLFDPGFTGIILVLTFFLGQSVSFEQLEKVIHDLSKEHRRHFYVLKFVLSIACLVGILLTYSRATYLAFLVGEGFAVFHFFRKKIKRELVFGLFYCIFLVAALPVLPRSGGEGVRLERTASVTARTSDIRETISSMKPLELITGKGIFVPIIVPPQIYGQPTHTHVTSNWFIFILESTGFVGLVLFAIILAHYFFVFQKMQLWLFTSFLAILCHGLFNATLFYPFVVFYFGGMIVSLNRDSSL